MAVRMMLGAQIHGVGHGWGEWRHPDALADASVNFPFYKRQAKLAEESGFDFVFIADSLHIHDHSSPHYLNRFEPLTILSALAASTHKIGLVGTVTVSYSEPFNVARQFASLDHISNGRAGWNVVTSWLSGTAANFGRARHPAHHERYAIAQEHVDVVRGLWDSWEDDAFVRDKQDGTFFRPGSLHALDHEGSFFSVKGPLNIARSRQGQPVIFQAGMSDEGRDFAARNADVVFCAPDGLESAQAYYADLKARAAKFGRDPSTLFVLPGIRPIVGSDADDARQRYDAVLSLVGIDDALPLLGRPFNDHDFSVYPLDEPFPELGTLGDNSQQLARDIKRFAKDEGLTLRQTALRVAAPGKTFAGTGTDVAATMEHWVKERGADGFIVNAPLPDGLATFTAHVLPVLVASGLFKDQDGEPTLRERLNLGVPVNRHSS
jgi:FMN-dependent oxidoreductase (nitrilotriacetate monooxygenase family)